MKEKGLGRSRKQNPHLTLMLLPYYMAVVTTKNNHTTQISLIISMIQWEESVVSKITKK
jgi:hypothetical protein